MKEQSYRRSTGDEQISITELYLAQVEKDDARKGFIYASREFWTSYYLIRKLTLVDF